MNNGFSTGEEDSRGHQDQTCCLIDDLERCRNQAGYARYSKRIQKTVAQKRLKLSIDPSAQQNINICDYHKERIQSVRTKRRRKDSEDDSNETDTDLHEYPDFYQLSVGTLRRYKRHFKVQTRQGMKRAQLADTIMKHFKTIPIKEKEIITYFVYMVKMGSNKLEKNGIGHDTT
ncbi:histone deacetylase complex subunit SAP30 homolog [Drosophila tropicalis]|uniref:Histone deacetylase complex subunit SAP30 Sin3 binding domain-containing protein n=1 Tax=Drosophila willistoni TaxID=7260 RepID=B4NPN7_DROWI|nr:histone deacetylase complex subunit SAP30 homolog [Drosophila willistoni]EDW86477.1 uncharacterized protein Dwil_GK18357 [Drosophila willistoni]